MKTRKEYLKQEWQWLCQDIKYTTEGKKSFVWYLVGLPLLLTLIIPSFAIGVTLSVIGYYNWIEKSER